MPARRDSGWSIVMSAPKARLRQAADFLKRQGIVSRFTRPKKQPGVLKVPLEEADRVRGLLATAFGDDVLSPADAAWYSCYDCGASLYPGQFRCTSCGAVVGDPHGR